MIRKITESSYFSFGVVMFLLCCAMWAGRAETKLLATEKNIDEQNLHLERVNTYFQSIDQRLSRIEGLLEERGNKYGK